jgi:hypothetical protein
MEKMRWETSELDDMKLVSGVLGFETIFFSLFTSFVAFGALERISRMLLLLALVGVTFLMFIATLVQLKHVHDFQKDPEMKVITDKK